jgi:tetratricopeptide (TPR) repeat protein
MIQAITWANLQEMMSSFYMGNWHPLTWFSYALDYAIFGLNPWGFHLTNLLWHSVNSVLFFLLSVRILNLQGIHEQISFFLSEQQVLWAAALAAFWFGIHPQHIESVVWIAERKDVLSLFFSLLTMFTYLNYVQTRRGRDYFISFLCFCLALMAKPMAVTLPIILLLLDIYPLHRTLFIQSLKRESLIKLGIEKIPFFVGSAVSAFLTLMAQHHAEFIASLVQVSLELRFVNACNSLLLYISKFLLPLGLSPFYPLDLTLLKNPLAYVPVFAIALITILSLYAWRKGKFYWLIIWLFYLVSLLPVLGLIQVGSQAAADRYAYFPTLPFYLFVAIIGIIGLFHYKKQWQLFSGIGILLISIGFSYMTMKQSEIWRNDLVFWTYVHHFSPTNLIAKASLGKAYFKNNHRVKALELWECLAPSQLQAQFTEQDYHQAITNLEQAAPHDSSGLTLYNLAQCYANMGKSAQALKIFERLLKQTDFELAPEILYYRIGSVHFAQGKIPEARAALEKVIALDPQAEPARALLKHLPPLSH